MSETLTREQTPEIDADEVQRIAREGLNLTLKEIKQLPEFDGVDEEQSATLNEDGRLHAEAARPHVEEAQIEPGNHEADTTDLDLSYEELGDLDSLGIYFRDSKKTPLLTAEEEINLAKRIEGGDLGARDHMIRANQGLVITHAKRFQFAGVPFADLIQEGQFGLMRAVDKFDHTKGFKFSTYADPWIRNFMQRAIGQYSRMVRVPSNIHEYIRKIESTASNLAVELERFPTDEEIAAKIGWTPERVVEIKNHEKQVVSTDLPVGPDGETTLGQLLPVEDNVHEVVEQSEDERVILEAVKVLEPEEKEVIIKLFGMDGCEPQSKTDIASEMGISTNKITKLEQSALAKLQDNENLRLLAA